MTFFQQSIKLLVTVLYQPDIIMSENESRRKFPIKASRTARHKKMSLLTQRGNKVFMGTQGLHATLVLIVPDTKRLIISTAHDELSTRMEQHSTHPVIVTNLTKAKYSLNDK